MADEKKKIEELTDDEASEAAGGTAVKAGPINHFTCKKCRHTFSGYGIRTPDGVYCTNCAPTQKLI